MRLFWRAFIGLLAFDFLLLGRNFARLHKIVREWKVADRKASEDIVGRVCKAMNYACVWYPKRALCLQRSVVMVCLLRCYGVPAQMVLGAQKLPFKAHAWVEIDGQAINERRNVQALYGVWERC